VQEIERDLVRWRRGQWVAVITTLFAVQLGLLIWASQKQIAFRVNYPTEPKVAFAIGGNMIDRKWLEMENPFLFAAASQNGFSGEAWLRQPKWQAPEPKRRDEPKFLQVPAAQKIIPRPQGEQTFALVQRHRVTAVLPEPPAAPVPAPESKLKLSAFNGRPLATPMTLPLQYHNDVLSPTVVEAMIDRDGLVISARLIENSGSPKADAEALALARRARFAPSRSGENIPDSGKLIFEWFALNLGDTNNVKR
jgi:TonB family protein